MDKIYADFRKPPPVYRAKPFWSWNGKLEADEIRRQIRIFKEMGFGGYFMHSRVGLITRYLGDEWFEMIDAGIDEGRKNNMEAWLYDEDRWPSGLAGGLVTRDPRWRNKRLNCLRVSVDNIPENALATFRFSLDNDGCLLSYQSVSADEIGKDEEILAFGVVEGERDSFYNGYTYLDTLSKDAVKAFIDSTYELYAERYSDEFGKTVPGVFTDEPNRGHFLGKWKNTENDYQIPWTDTFLEEFQNRMGYDIINRLPEVFYNVSGDSFSKTRYDIGECLNQLLIEAFAIQVAEWCEDHNLVLTGHVLHENTLANQLSTSGSMARFYEHMQAPGMDILGRAIFYNVPKQVQSVARQCGQKWVLSEMYANNGWDYPLETFKTYGDWQAVLGINFRCPHLALYTMSGERKRDCPPTISFHQPWWREYHLVEDYFARISVIISQGEPICDLLFIHPIDPLTGIIAPGWARGLESVDESLNKIERAFQDITRWLLGLQVDFDYGDEEMLGRMAEIKMADDGPVIVVGQMRYKRVIVPPMPSLRPSTMNLLIDFSKAGGEVVWIEEPPAHVDGTRNSKPNDVAGKTHILPLERDEFSRYYRSGRFMTVADANGDDATDIFAHFRKSDDAVWLYLTNVNYETGLQDAIIQILAVGQIQEWNPESGERFIVPADLEDGVTTFKTSFAPGGSRIFAIVQEADNSLPEIQELAEVDRIFPKEKEFTIRLDEPNVIPIDRARYRFEDEEWSDNAEFILQIDRLARHRLDLEPRSTNMIQPWFRDAFPEESGPRSDESAALSLSFGFEIGAIPEKDIEIALEQSDRYKMQINGSEVPLINKAGYWIEPCLSCFSIPCSLLKEGKNEIILEVQFDETLDLESAFLLGDFSVKVDGKRVIMGAPVRKLTLGNWTKQGLPFYAGSVCYEMNFDAPESPASHIAVPDFDGSCIRIPGSGTIAWKPYELRLNQAMDGNGTIEIEVVGHRRNSFGPIGIPDGYNLVPLGLMEMPYLSVRK